MVKPFLSKPPTIISALLQVASELLPASRRDRCRHRCRVRRAVDTAAATAGRRGRDPGRGRGGAYEAHGVVGPPIGRHSLVNITRVL